MLDYVFISVSKETHSFSLSEFEYGELIKMGIEKVGIFTEKAFKIETEDYYIEVIELEDKVRDSILNMIQNYIWDLINNKFNKQSLKNTSIDEIRMSLNFMYKLRKFKIEIENENNKWLSINP